MFGCDGGFEGGDVVLLRLGRRVAVFLALGGFGWGAFRALGGVGMVLVEVWWGSLSCGRLTD